MNIAKRLVLPLVLVLVAGCATSKITDSSNNIGNRKIAKPGHIVVYDFAATAADLGSEAGQYASAPQTPEEIATGRKLAASVATQLVSEIEEMGLPARRDSGRGPDVGDIVIKGRFESVDEGEAGKRILVGFGSGKAELRTAVQGYLMTENGLRKLGQGEVDSGGGKSPGLLVPLAVTVATANPIGLLVGGAVKASGEISGRDKIEGAAKRTAETIAERLEERFKEQGWIED
jgi:hypothetical protein